MANTESMLTHRNQQTIFHWAYLFISSVNCLSTFFDALTLPINNFQQHFHVREQIEKEKKRSINFISTLFSVASFNANILRWTKNNTSKTTE